MEVWALSFVLWLYRRVHNCWMLIHSGLLPVISRQLRFEICPTEAERLKGTLISLLKTTQWRLLCWIQMKSCPFEHPHYVTAASRVESRNRATVFFPAALLSQSALEKKLATSASHDSSFVQQSRAPASSLSFPSFRFDFWCINSLSGCSVSATRRKRRPKNPSRLNLQNKKKVEGAGLGWHCVNTTAEFNLISAWEKTKTDEKQCSEYFWTPHLSTTLSFDSPGCRIGSMLMQSKAAERVGTCKQGVNTQQCIFTYCLWVGRL